MTNQQKQKSHATATLLRARKRKSKNKSRILQISQAHPIVSVTKARFQLAIAHSFGVKSRIAEALGITTGSVNRLLKKDGWEDVAVIYEEERDRVGDMAECTVFDIMLQRMDSSAALKAATWYLSKIHKKRGYDDKNVTIIEGGKNPIQVENKTDLETLDLPLEVRVAILEAIEKKEADAQAKKEAD